MQIYDKHTDLFQFGLGHSADAVRTEVGVPGLNAPQTAQVLVALLLPLSDQVFVGDLLPQTVLVQFYVIKKNTYIKRVF